MQCEIVLGLVILDKELKVLCCYVNFQVGRLPMEWAKTVIPLVQSGRVRVRGRCIAAPDNLQMMQEIMLLVRYKLLAPSTSSDEIILMKAFLLYLEFSSFEFGLCRC